jgi:hypothetical protein
VIVSTLVMLLYSVEDEFNENPEVEEVEKE